LKPSTKLVGVPSRVARSRQVDGKRHGLVVTLRLDKLLELRPNAVDVASQLRQVPLAGRGGGGLGHRRTCRFGVLPFCSLRLGECSQLTDAPTRAGLWALGSAENSRLLMTQFTSAETTAAIAALESTFSIDHVLGASCACHATRQY
jgi:hypothetical protein